MNTIAQIKVLFVCMGNICRSPTAEGVFQKLVADEGLDHLISIDSAGTHAYHVGSSPDNRAQAAAKKRNIDLSRLRGRQIIVDDFDAFDYVLVMDGSNLRDVLALQEKVQTAQVQLFLDFAANAQVREVPDPYYGGTNGFEYVLDLIEDASRGLLDHIRDHDLKV
jgi:protein-tyrosine phosphatase